MRIVLVTVFYPPNVVAGGTLIPQRIAEELKARGHDVWVYSGEIDINSAPHRVRVSVQNDLEITRYNTGFALPEAEHDNYENPMVAEHFARYLADRKPDVVHFHCIQGLGANLLPVAKATGSQVIVTPHDQWWWCVKQFLVDDTDRPCLDIPALGSCPCATTRDDMDHRNYRAGVYFRQADRVLAVSPAMRRQLIANGVAPHKVWSNENAIPPLVGSQRSEPEPGTPVRFLFAGGSGRIKGGQVVAAAVSLLGDLPGWTLSMPGFDWQDNGQIPPPLGAKLANHSAVSFPPAYAPESVGAVMSAHDVLLMTSTAFESSSVVVREALASGCAVITGDNPGPCDAVTDGVNGLVVPRSDAVALASAMRTVIGDRELLRRLQSADVVEVAARTIAQQVSELEEYYRYSPPPTKDRIRTVVALTGGPAATNRYRVGQVKEALSSAGVHLDIFEYHDGRLRGRVGNSDAYLLHRVPATVQILEWIAQIREVNPTAIVLFDIDDLVIDTRFREQLDPVLSSVGVDLDEYWQGVLRYRTTLEACDAVVTSTPSLAQQLRQLTDKPVFVYRNGVSATLARRSARARNETSRAGRLRFGYFSGSATHQPDWDLIAPAVAEALVRFDAELLLVGEVSAGPAFADLTGRVTTIGVQHWMDLPYRIAEVDINLAPLRADVFNDCKSAIKYQEAALAGVPTIASATAPFRAAIEPSVTGLLCESLDDWRSALATLAEDSALRTKLAAAAQRQVLADLGPGPQGWRYREILETVADLAADTAPVSSAWVPTVIDDPWLTEFAVASPTSSESVTSEPTSVGRRLVRKVRKDGVSGLITAVGRRLLNR